MDLELTDERVMPKKMNPNNGLLKEHIVRYEFASNYAQGRVLDLACGVGYGTEVLLAQGEQIEEIIGVDLAQESIDYAKYHYGYPLVDFMVGEGTDPNLVEKLGQFDTIISFETVEHIKDDYKFIANLNNLLKDTGQLIISTPFGRGREKECSNPYHYRQYTEEEFRELLERYFEIELFYQLNERIEKRQAGVKYYLMVAICCK
ncbi:class I SAM-dependent methyltransferase [Natroniella sulfidigena]|uniref:class I SAM-dependent methyltransferase n=1 Tax=Natroniella sulfidigena TaxID=723921 RepID=UPI002009EA73|nr:class I SAM-dependent methyltransferase [Natroniella sulfidigena]MCK8816981.1 class I SAM-dependent methyltransferase [Natroniella sulfidigena]